MDLPLVQGIVFLSCSLLVLSEGKTQIGDYIVDCSACNSVPVQGVSSYSCKVRCEAEGETNVNLTGFYDMLIQLSEELRITKQDLKATKQKQQATEEELNATKHDLDATKQKQLATEEELNATKRAIEKELEATRELLKIDVSFNVQITGHVPLSDGDKLLFDNVISNIGNGYNATVGIFTAPHNGKYEFTLITLGQNGYHYGYITVNGIRLSVTHGASSYRSGVAALSKKLFVGDQVWVETGNTVTYNG